MGNLTNLRKAVVLLSSVSPTEATMMLARLDPQQLELVAAELSRSTAPIPQEQHDVGEDFVRASGYRAFGKARESDLPSTSLGRAADKRSGQDDDQWVPLRRLQTAPAEQLTEILKSERPQTIALVVYHLPPMVASQVMASLSSDVQVRVVSCISTMGVVDREVLDLVDQTVAAELEQPQNRTVRHDSGTVRLARILNYADTSTERALLENLSQENRRLVDRILQLMFVCRDLDRIGA
ncbi:MAG: hypothetical protein KDA99_28220 [Planctomycetales bacterium]|nr:hypothetical protein [Planctomycetales bacterium]